MADLLERLQAVLGDAFRVEQELARGGMSRLFLATERSLDRKVVIKLLPPELSSEVSAARFQREIAVTAKLQHPNILPVLSAGARDGLLYYTMPYVEGESLRHRLDAEKKVSLEQALQILREVADALAYAHERGIVHRDIKPENILLEQGHAVLADFGIARAVEQARTGDNLTQAGAAVGTVRYMSPEQAAGEDIDARADIYALAVVGYEMLAGQPPFGGASLQAVVAAQLTTDPTPLEDLRPDTPPSVAAAIAAGMAKDPAHRLARAADLRDAVTGTMTSSRFARPRRWRWPLVAASLAFVAAIGWGVVSRSGADEDPRHSLIVFPFTNRTGDAQHDYLQEAAMHLLGLAVSQWEDLRVYDDERTASLLRRNDVGVTDDLDFEDARRMAREARVGTMVLGDVRREGDSLSIEAKVHDVRTGDRIATESMRAPRNGDPRVVFDSLAGRILRVSGAPPGDRPGVVRQTTRSLEAYRSYLAGSYALQRFAIDSARTHLERAIALDSTFALAYLRLRDVEGWAGLDQNNDRRREVVAKAQQYAQNLSPRLRTLVQYHVAYEAGDLRRARALAQELIARDSTDVEAWYQLGEAHWHDNVGTFPHPDTAGNAGIALKAFRKTLELDSNYTVAYLHTLDALRACGQWGVTVCLADSAVYGAPDTLRRRFGERAVERIREEARRQSIATARAWVTAAPATKRARIALVQVLVDQERYEEAVNEARLLRATGADVSGRALEGWVRLLQQRYPEAAAALGRAPVESPAAARTLIEDGIGGLAALGYSGAGRPRDAVAQISLVFDHVTGDTVNTVIDRRLARPVARVVSRAAVLADVGVTASTAGAVRQMLDTLARHYGDDPEEHGNIVTGAGWIVVSSYLATRDTVALSRFDALTDTTQSATWRSARALLTLARGDTAQARARVRRDLDNADPTELGTSHFAQVRRTAWADLQAQLGRVEEAIALLNQLDTADAISQHPAMLVRTWAERGALYQLQGDTASAVAMYEKVLDAWRDGDPDVQPFLERVRGALAALRGVASEPPRR